MKRLLLTSMAAIGLIGLTACSGGATRLRLGDEDARQRTQQWPLTVEEQAAQRRQFAVQVMGVQWINPVMRRSYPTHWNLLWTLNIAKTDPDDYDAKHDPDYLPRQGRLPAVRAVVDNAQGGLSFFHYLEGYVVTSLSSYRVPYFVSNLGFYGVKKNGSGRTWYDLPVWAALSSQVKDEDAKTRVAQKIYNMSDGMERDFNPENRRPTVHVLQGHAAGFRSLSAAMDYLEANPDKTAWVMAMDAPDFPKDKQPTENSVILILANADRPN